MSGACDNFILEDQSCEWFELVQYVESFDMGINFLEGKPGPPGPAGEAIFIPSVSEDGWISWTNTAGLPNPDPVYIKGPPGGGGSGDYDDLTDKPSINGVTLSGNKTTADLLIAFTAADVGLGNVANERQYSAQNPPPYPVTSVAGKTGAVGLLPSDVGLGNVANERQYSSQNPPPYPVTSVNGKTGAVKLNAADVGALGKDGILIPDTAFAIPAEGASVSYSMDGFTKDHMLVLWNFSSSAENQPPVDLRWDAYNGYFTITNEGGTTSESIQPVFVLPTAKAIIAR